MCCIFARQEQVSSIFSFFIPTQFAQMEYTEILDTKEKII